MSTDTATRAETVKRDLLARANAIAAAANAGRPCSQCRNLVSRSDKTAPYCASIALTSPTYDPVDGQVVQSIEVPAAKARAADGVCGPEGLLFEPRRFAFIRHHLARADIYSGILAAWLFTGLVFWALVAS